MNQAEHSINDVLIVDDSTANLKFLTNILSTGGYSIHQDISGELAISKNLGELM